MTLVFEEQRMYMHNASGMFGSVPLTLTGELQLSLCDLQACLQLGTLVTSLPTLGELTSMDK